jgi:hypothetical protein
MVLNSATQSKVINGFSLPNILQNADLKAQITILVTKGHTTYFLHGLTERLLCDNQLLTYAEGDVAIRITVFRIF